MNLFLIRHGLSEANVDEELYKIIPDHKIKLTSVGISQAAVAGQTLQDEYLNPIETTKIIHSPWERAKSTAHIISTCITKIPHTLEEDILIHEQSICHSTQSMTDKKDYNHPDKFIYGEFWYKVDGGESLADCYNRARLFVNELRAGKHRDVQNLVVVSHGVFITMVQAVLNGWEVSKILDTPPPQNCSIIVECTPF